MKQFSFIFLLILVLLSCKAQNINAITASENLSVNQTNRPKLVVGIVVDQMRYDYLTRFDSKYGNGEGKFSIIP